MHYIKHYPLAWLVVIAICYLSLFFRTPETELNDVPFMDKWVHICMYGGLCTVIWIEYLRRHRVLSLLRLSVGSILCPILLGGILEIVQATCTTTRTGDWLDFAANSTGVLLAAAMGYWVWRPLFRRMRCQHTKRDPLD